MASTMSRRNFLRTAGKLGVLAAAAGAVPLLGGCGPLGDQEKVNLTHFIWVGGGQGIVPREVVPEYEKKHPNVKIELYEGTNAVTYPKMVAAKEADPNKPLINFGFYNVDATVKGTRDDMWLSLDEKKIPNMKHILPGFRRPENKGIGWGMTGIGLIYNTNLVKEPPTSWLDILAPRFKGKVVTFDYGFNLLLVPLIYALKGNPKDGDEEAWQRLIKAAADKQFLAFGASNEDVKNPVVRGDALIAPWFSSQVRVWTKDEGAPVAYVVPKEGQLAFPLFFQIVKGSTVKQVQAASDIINEYLNPPTLARYCNNSKTIPASTEVKLADDLKDDVAFTAKNVEGAMAADWDTIAARDAEWRKRWDREVKAKM